MEDQVTRVRRRVPRKRTLGQRIKKALEMPRLSRSKRNQRVAILAMIVLLAVYLLVAPTLSDMFGSRSTQTTSPSAPAPAKLRNKK